MLFSFLLVAPSGTFAQKNIDFIDIAAFRITGNIRYKDTNFPVEDATFYIDNKIVVAANGIPIKSDNLGNYEIYVPIGWHYFEVKMNNHRFADNGR